MLRCFSRREKARRRGDNIRQLADFDPLTPTLIYPLSG
jgi:hypothetical protein